MSKGFDGMVIRGYSHFIIREIALHPSKWKIESSIPNEDVPKGTLNNILKQAPSQELRRESHGIRRYF